MMTVHEGVCTYRNDLTRYALSLVGPQRAADADDLVQSCLLRALEKADQYEEGTNLRAWLFTLMRSLFISECRHEKICRNYAERIGRGPPLCVQPGQYFHVMLRETARAMRSLDAADIAHLQTLAIGEQRYVDAAARHGVPIGTMKARLSRSRSKLRSALHVGRGPVSSALAA